MTATTKTTILNKSKQLFALHGYEGFSIRILSKESGVGLSSIYHFFEDKDQILTEIFKQVGKELGQKRQELPARRSANDMLKDRILFQFTNIEDVVFVLKYYLHFRPQFLRLDSGYIPSKAYLHVEEVLHFGIQTSEFAITEADVEKQSKVIAHAINGFLLEYYPSPPQGKELKSVVASIHSFLIRGLTNKEVQPV
ncbi:MAG: TetR/AcrR family transcriptional regulator [Candidatus Saccharibacteria bacterium]|nr:TetR/AcrR family transcriptional regulator [Candidatus Saccharibacteria bacterium]